MNHEQSDINVSYAFILSSVQTKVSKSLCSFQSIRWILNEWVNKYIDK